MGRADNRILAELASTAIHPRTIRARLSGELIIRAPQALTASTVADKSSLSINGDVADVVRRLSIREVAILRLIMAGASNKVISNQLDITEATVKVHNKSILRKIRVQNRTQAAVWAHNHLDPFAE